MTTPGTVMDFELPLALKIWDAHVHNWNRFSDLDLFRAHLDRHGITRVNLLGPLIGGFTPSPLEVETSNNQTAHFREALPHRVAAFCYVNPRNESHALREWKRCRAIGFAGLKLWVAARCNTACSKKIVEAVVDDGAPVLIHTWSKAGGNLEGESPAEDVAELAATYPHGRFIMAHIGGRFERSLAAIRNSSNVIVDYSGSANEAGAYELALEQLGPDRIVFGTDGPHDFLSCVGRVLEATPSPAIRRKIFFSNMEALIPSAADPPSTFLGNP